MWMAFEFDKQKIESDGLYSYEEIISMLEHFFNKEGITSNTRGIYEGDYEQDYDKFFRVLVRLMQKDWIRRYCSKWLFNNPEEGLGDVLMSMKQHNLCLDGE